MTSLFERHDLRLWKTRQAAESNAKKLTAEFEQLGQSATWSAIQKSNGWWTVEKVIS
jgi:hypothetical protein